MIPITITRTAMTTPTDLLTLSQWLSPAFPVGAYTYSHGLEAAFEAGWVTDATSLQDWLSDLLTHGSMRSDAIFLAAAYHGDTPLADLDVMACAFASSAERLLETQAQGRAFCQTIVAIWGDDLAGLTYPVALGRAAASQGVPLDLTLTLYLQAFLSNLIAAAQRLGPIGQTEGQRILHNLTQLIAETADTARAGDLTMLSSATFLSDIAAMRHETQYSRIFRS